ncbi:MAG: hypothetical protein JHC87_08255 [Thermoleophilaceae bacterium]|nr:hypothetical protein [Thermoleophilaceae bacterium]
MPNSEITRAKPATNGKAAAKKAQPDAKDSRVLDISDQWLGYARTGQVLALEATRKFVELVDDTVPLGGEGSRRRELVNGAFQLADGVAQAQLGLLRGAVHGMVFVNVAVDVNAFNGTDVDVSVPTSVFTRNQQQLPA